MRAYQILFILFSLSGWSGLIDHREAQSIINENFSDLSSLEFVISDDEGRYTESARSNSIVTYVSSDGNYQLEMSYMDQNENTHVTSFVLKEIDGNSITRQLDVYYEDQNDPSSDLDGSFILTSSDENGQCGFQHFIRHSACANSCADQNMRNMIHQFALDGNDL